LETLPPPPGIFHVPSPAQNVDPDADVPELRLLTDRLPVTPPARGSPVAFVKVRDEGVPRAGVPAVQVIAGVVVAVATEHVTPKTDGLGKLVTVPEPDAHGAPASTTSPVELACKQSPFVSVPLLVAMVFVTPLIRENRLAVVVQSWPLYNVDGTEPGVRIIEGQLAGIVPAPMAIPIPANNKAPPYNRYFFMASLSPH
jgi:hypothetical protein